jgi:fido (protein-threonine AMPylation protein)
MSDKYGTGQDKRYCYPSSTVLINKLGITDAVALEAAEIELTQARIEQFEPNFDDISLAALLGNWRAKTTSRNCRARSSSLGSPTTIAS